MADTGSAGTSKASPDFAPHSGGVPSTPARPQAPSGAGELATPSIISGIGNNDGAKAK